MVKYRVIEPVYIKDRGLDFNEDSRFEAINKIEVNRLPKEYVVKFKQGALVTDMLIHL